ncbi:hypothetical protein ABNF65_22045 [Paenibacillus larvae]
MKNELKKELSELVPKIESFLEVWHSYQDCFDENDPEDMYLRTMFWDIWENIYNVLELQCLMEAEVLAEGPLIKNDYGNYYIESTDEPDKYITTAFPIEYLEENGAEWKVSGVSQNEKDYYLTADPKLKMSGLRARIKDVPFVYLKTALETLPPGEGIRDSKGY